MNQKMCEECGENAANVHLTQIASGQTIVMHLCEKCASKKGIAVTSGEIAPPAPDVAAAALPDIECPRCKLTYSEFKNRGRLGCGDCYGAFAGPVDELLVQVHGSCRHKGKQYVSAATCEPEPAADIRTLRDEMRTAVRNEKFELAAAIRDKIHSIEKTAVKDCTPA
jgi:protein arginine kinase activator